MRQRLPFVILALVGLVVLAAAAGSAAWLGVTPPWSPEESAASPTQSPTPSPTPTPAAPPGPALERERFADPAADRSDRALGINLSIPSFGGDTPFTDAMRNALPFRTQQGEYVTRVGPDGMPGRVEVGEPVFTVVAGLAGQYLPAGDYTLTYAGDGDVRVESAAGEVVDAATVDGRTTATFRYDPTGVMEPEIVITIDRSDRDDPVRDMHLYLPGYTGAPGEPTFMPEFLDLWSSYGLVRTMQAQAIWDFAFEDDVLATDVTWGDRATVEEFHWGERWPYEPMTELVNELDQDLWINVPHTATDQYMGEMATFFRDRLEPGRHLYVEFTNECWNGISTAHEHAVIMGTAAGLGVPDAGDGGFSAALEWCAFRTADADRIFTEVYAEQGREEEVVSVLGVFTAAMYPYHHHEDDPEMAGVLHQIHPTLGAPVYELVDSLGVTGYVGGAIGEETVIDQTSQWSVDDVFAYILDDELPPGTANPDEFTDSIPDLVDTLTAWRELADDMGLGLHAYEAGPHLVAPGNVQASSLTYDVTQDPRIGLVVTEVLDGMREAGVEQIGLYTSAEPAERDLEWTRFGLIPNTFADEGQAPRWQAAEAWARAHGAWWMTDTDAG